MKRPSIIINHVLSIRHALQGHPESPILWVTMIHSISTDPSVGFKSDTHKPCLYHGKIKGEPIFLLR